MHKRVQDLVEEAPSLVFLKTFSDSLATLCQERDD